MADVHAFALTIEASGEVTLAHPANDATAEPEPEENEE